MQLTLSEEMIERIEAIDVIELRSEYLKLHDVNKDIFNSFSYAATIQQGLLPQQRHFDRLFNEYFVIYKPQSIIGGDFYWITEKDDCVIFAVADCTGHGIAGAMLSVLGIGYLNYVVLGKNHNNLGDILEEVDKKWVETFNKLSETGINNDWAEISLGSFNPKTRELKFAGARGKIIIVNDEGTQVIKGDNFPIGGWQIEKDRVFKEHKMILPKDSMIYMTSDGFQHQFGGKKNKKFSGKTMQTFLEDIYDLPATIQKAFLSMTFNEWQGNNLQTDDVCVLGLKF
jgi:serine phosphatase RsbU (regulator of sigma subunit)